MTSRVTAEDLGRCIENQYQFIHPSHARIPFGHVYVLSMGGDHKIGATSGSAKSRAIEVGRYERRKGKRHGETSVVWEANVPDPFLIKHILQSKFMARHVEREWYRLTPDDMNEISSIAEMWKEVANAS